MNGGTGAKGYRASQGTAREHDVIVVGAGMVGAAIAYGLGLQGQRVLLLDGADTDYRAAKANFGLVWLQGKGQNQPHYHRLSHRSALAWPDFAAQLTGQTGIRLDYERRGGLHFCLDDAQMQARADSVQRWHAQTPDLAPCVRMADRGELLRLFPGMALGPGVAGASVGELDGHLNPLRLLLALHTAVVAQGGALRGNHAVSAIVPLTGGGFEVVAGLFRARAARVVLAAGLGTRALGAGLGLDVPLRPQRGQLLVTERLGPLLPVPASGIRQTAEGSVMIGMTQEEVGYDLTTTTGAAARMSRGALRIFPALAGARLVRHWSCLRIMTPDGGPVYAESTQFPGAFVALCHSGVTLAAFHAGAFAQAVAAGSTPAFLDAFHHERFDVQKVA